MSDARGAHLRRLRGEEQKRAATAGILKVRPVSVVRRERRISQPWLKTAAEISRLRSRGITYRHLRKVPFPCYTESYCSLKQLHWVRGASCPKVSREARRSALLPFSARATFHPDCTVGTGFSPVRPLLRAGFSSGVFASCADAKIRTISACLRERFAGCDRRFGISPTPEHDVDTDYATAHAGGLICFLWDNFRDKMTFYDCTLGASSSPSKQVPTAAAHGTVLNLILQFSGMIYHGFITVESAKQTKEL